MALPCRSGLSDSHPLSINLRNWRHKKNVHARTRAQMKLLKVFLGGQVDFTLCRHVGSRIYLAVIPTWVGGLDPTHPPVFGDFSNRWWRFRPTHPHTLWSSLKMVGGSTPHHPQGPYPPPTLPMGITASSRDKFW